jgi:hypothetical protein
MCHRVVLCLTNTVLKFIFIFSDRKAGGSAVPPRLLGTVPGVLVAVPAAFCLEYGSGVSCGLCGMRTGPGTGLRNGAGPGTESGSNAESGDRTARLRTRSGTGSESRTDTPELLPCGASDRLVDPIFYLNRTVFPVRGLNRLVHSEPWSSPSFGIGS